MLEVDATKRLGNFSLQVRFRTRERGVTALFGPSGAGKTTVVNIIAGLVRPDQGRVVLNGTVLFDSRRNIDLAPQRRRIGYVFQEGRLFPHLSVKNNLLYGMRLLSPAQQGLGLMEVVQLMGIGHLMSRRPAGLSGGEKQRVALGRALLTSPNLLLMDEPLASLDQERRDEVLPFLACLPGRLGIPIIYVSHDMKEIKALDAVVVRVSRGNTCQADGGGEKAHPGIYRMNHK